MKSTILGLGLAVLIATEMFPPQERGLGYALGVMLLWMAGILITNDLVPSDRVFWSTLFFVFAGVVTEISGMMIFHDNFGMISFAVSNTLALVSISTLLTLLTALPRLSNTWVVGGKYTWKFFLTLIGSMIFIGFWVYEWQNDASIMVFNELAALIFYNPLIKWGLAVAFSTLLGYGIVTNIREMRSRKKRFPFTRPHGTKNIKL